MIVQILLFSTVKIVNTIATICFCSNAVFYYQNKPLKIKSMNFNQNITINDFTSICRLCLKSKGRLKPIFKPESEHDQTNAARATFSQMISTCLGLEVNHPTICNLQIINYMSTVPSDQSGRRPSIAHLFEL